MFNIDLLHANHFSNGQFVAMKDVVSYEHLNFDKWRLQLGSPADQPITIDSMKADTRPIYMALDTEFHGAFGHWFFESAVWLPTIKNMMASLPSMKILLKENRKYKEQIISYFDIPMEKVTTEFEHRNYMVFAAPGMALNSMENVDLFAGIVERFHVWFGGAPQAGNNKTENILLMPRQKRENFKHNDRSVDSSDIENYLEETGLGVIFHTDDSPNLSSQVKAVQSSRTFIVTDGSSAVVNGFFTRNTNIIVLGDALLPLQSRAYPKLKYVCNIIERNNCVTYVHSASNVFKREDVLALILS